VNQIIILVFLYNAFVNWYFNFSLYSLSNPCFPKNNYENKFANPIGFILRHKLHTWAYVTWILTIGVEHVDLPRHMPRGSFYTLILLSDFSGFIYSTIPASELLRLRTTAQMEEQTKDAMAAASAEASGQIHSLLNTEEVDTLKQLQLLM